MSSIRHIVVARAASSVRFAPGESLTINGIPAGDQRATVIVQTRYNVEGFTAPVPRELWIEARGAFLSLDRAVVDLANASAMVLPAIAFCANAPIEEPEPEMAFELHEGGNEHKLYQRHVAQEVGFPRARRRAPRAAIGPFIEKWLAHRDADRIYRTLAQYALALRHGAAGREILALAHFYMAVEALTKALLRDECVRTGMNEDQLAAEWKIEKQRLDGEVRLRRAFGGDREAYRAAKKVSDGFEHGFANYPEIRSQAEAVARKAGAGLRRAVLDLISLDAKSRGLLLADPWGDPMDPRPLEQVVRGNLIGPSDALASKSQVYPCLRWSLQIADYLGEDAEGNMQFKLKDTTFTPLIGPNAGFQLTSFEVRRPDPHGRITPITGTGTVRMPHEVLQDLRRQVEEVRASLPAMTRAMLEGQMHELFTALGKRSRNPSRREISELQRRLVRSEKNMQAYFLGLAALSGQLPANIARYVLLERAMAETMASCGIGRARQGDGFDLLLTKMANGLREGEILTRQEAYPAVIALRDQLLAYLSQPEYEARLMRVLDHWYSSQECKTIIHYAGQYEARAARFLFQRPTRYTQRVVIRLSEQYAHHAGLLQQQLRLLIALDQSAQGEQLVHSDVAEKNLASLLASAKTNQAVRHFAEALNRRIRNALAHGVPQIDLGRRRCVFRERGETVDLTFDELFDQTMCLTVTTLSLLFIDQRLQERWMRQRLDMLLRG